MLPILIPVSYHRRAYPAPIEPGIQEVACHFDVEKIAPSMPYSLHTEYSYGKRSLDSELMQAFPRLMTSHEKQVPQLWASDEWALEFAQFIFAITEGSEPPAIVEVHPPFRDYCESLDNFLGVYALFESELTRQFPEVNILLENRCGTIYPRGRFLVSTSQDIAELVALRTFQSLRLGFALDLPQLLTAVGGPDKLRASQISEVIKSLEPCRGRIRGLHLWGKKRSAKGRWVAHAGNLDTYFDNDIIKKRVFLDSLRELLSDGVPRYFLPEVNSSDDHLAAIVADLADAGFHFQET
jgi:hypothetical protein